jgi:glutathione S-transferase
MEILHTSNIIKSKLDFIDIDLEDINKRNKYAQKTPTATLPFLETKNGNISESKSIEIYLANKYKPDILGNNIFEKSKINQWIEFANCEIQNCINELIYPIFKGKKKKKKEMKMKIKN